MMRRGMRAVAAVLTLTLMVGLSACQGQVPVVQSNTSSSQAPDLTKAQEKTIRKEILAVVNKANDTKNTDGLDQRMTGPALAIRTSELAIAKATGKLDAKTDIPSDMTQTVIPTNSGWPRLVYTITTTTQDQQSKRLLVLKQDSARSNYKLWAVARLFQGAKLPKFAIATIGSQIGESDDSGLVATPQEAVRQYADVLQNGSSSKYASNFVDDYFRQDLSQLTATVQQGMERNKGTQQQVFTPSSGAISVMRSADGGDLVVASIDSVWTRAAGEGRESQPASDAEKALFGNGKATSTMKVTYVNVVALYIPPAKDKQPITAVGAEWQPVKVEAL